MSNKLKFLIIFSCLLIIGYISYTCIKNINPNPRFKLGQILDSIHGVKVYYNGNVSHVGKRHLSKNGYNLGLEYQCVEFVKRYYYEFYHHEMPDSYGNAKDFFDPNIKNGSLNQRRKLIQFKNPSINKPRVGDLVIFDGHPGNSYGHVAIISNVSSKEVEIIQQNPGPFASSRVVLSMDSIGSGFYIGHERLLGWLRMPD